MLCPLYHAHQPRPHHLPVHVCPGTVGLQANGLRAVQDGLGEPSLPPIVSSSGQVGLRAMVEEILTVYSSYSSFVSKCVCYMTDKVGPRE